MACQIQTLAYQKHFKITDVKSFMTSPPARKVAHQFPGRPTSLRRPYGPGPVSAKAVRKGKGSRRHRTSRRPRRIPRPAKPARTDVVVGRKQSERNTGSAIFGGEKAELRLAVEQVSIPSNVFFSSSLSVPTNKLERLTLVKILILV